MTVLFVCDSNAVRSPLAEAIARHLSPHHEFLSAGWSPSHVRPEVRAALAEAGISALGLRAKSMAETPLEEVDVVVSLSEDEGTIRTTARRIAWWLADPSSAPPEERMEAYRATREELTRRIGILLAELA